MTKNELRSLDQWIATNLFDMDAALVPYCSDYTTDASATMSVLEKIVERGKHAEHNILIFIPDDQSEGKWGVSAEFACVADEMEEGASFADSLPLAICLFAKRLFESKL